MIRSPFFYVGDKYKIMHQIISYFPKKIDRYFEPFVGGGSSFLNVLANEYYLNDINSKLIDLHKFFIDKEKESDKFFFELEKIIFKFGLSYSYKIDLVPFELKKMYPKKYYAVFNKESYEKMKYIYNNEQNNNLYYLYLLLIYGFNRMMRFNKNNDFNVPVGNLDFNKNVKKSIEDYFQFSNNKNINFSNFDCIDFLNNMNLKKFDFIYLDPPYLISTSEYNKLWNTEIEIKLLNKLDELNCKGIKFAISNLIIHKGKTNKIFENWAKKYTIIDIKSNYISYHDNSKKDKSREVLVINYEKEIWI